MRSYHVIGTPWGPFICVHTSAGLAETCLFTNLRPSIEKLAARRWPDARRASTGFSSLRRAITRYFQGRPAEFDVPLDLSGWSEFTQSVLEACRRIPYGRTASYEDLARAVGRRGAARAVGTVMARNPLPVIVPCHRVIRSDGSLGGYSARDGVKLKRRLLHLEGGGAFA